MGFLEGLGEFMGTLAAKAQAQEEAFNLYQSDYEYMNKQELIGEYKKLKAEKEKLFHSDEIDKRYDTVRRLLRRMNENG